MDCSDLNDFEDDDIIEPCRACGIYFISNNNTIQPIFTNLKTGENSNGNMQEIIQLMNEWNIQVEENDGRPQNICRPCIGEFQKVLQFKRSCLETQDQFDALDVKRAQNGVVIKREIEPEQTFCGFIYLDTDDEEDSEEDGSRRVCAPLDIPHMPIKEEHAARVPLEAPYQPAIELDSKARVLQEAPQLVNIQTASNLPEEAMFAHVMAQEITTTNGLSSTPFEANHNESPDSDEDVDIIKFTYDDDCDDNGQGINTLPTPIQETNVYCKLCGHASSTQEKHTEHMSRMHMIKDCECHICGKKFVNAHESRLRFHMKWHKLQKHHKCPICGFFCNSKDTLKEHKLAVHTRKKCDFCGKNIKKQQLQAHLNRHLKEHEEELALKLKSMQTKETPVPTVQESCLIQCAFCDLTFNDTEQLQVHVLGVHITTSEDPADPEALETSLMSTNSLHESWTANSTTAQNTSNSSAHSDSSDQNTVVLYKCHICPKSFNLNIKLKRHLQQHS